jgi:hypothetical protein
MQDKKGLSSTTVVFMIVVALFFDALQALLMLVGIGWFVPIISYPTFWLWFRFRGLNFFSLKRASVLGIGALIELIPGLNILPAFTLTVARIALKEKIKEVVPGADITKLDIMNRK